MPRGFIRTVFPYVIAAVAVAAATFVRMLLGLLFAAQIPYSLYFPAIALAAMTGGMRVGVFATALSMITASIWFELPVYRPPTPLATVAVGVLFCSVGLLLAYMSALLRKARSTAEQRTEALRESEQRYRGIVEAAQEGIWILDLSGRTTYANSKMAELMACGVDELIGLHFTEYFLLPDRDAARQRVSDRLSGRLKGVSEVRLRRRDGSTLLAQVNVSVLMDAAGDAVGLMGLVSDITARHQLLATAEQLRLHIANSPLGIIEFDRDGRILTWSARATEIFGWESREAIGKTSTELALIPEEDLASVRAAAAAATDSRQRAAIFRNRNRRKDGATIQCEWYVSFLYDDAGRWPSILAQVLDVTARRHIEEERDRLLAETHAARMEAERANCAKDEFLATLSHELRSPMQAVLGWVSLMERGQLGGERLRQAVEVISRNVRHERQLIDDMLDISRIVAGKLQIEREPADLRAIVREIVDSFLPAAQERSVRLSTHLDDCGLLLVDHHRMRQVVGNLLNNALNFSPPGSVIEVDVVRQDGHARIRIRDHGEGIEPHVLPHVFERFHQADGTSTRRHGGLGLGLAIAKHLVEMHGGTIEAASEGKGRGATFDVRLPLIGAPTVLTKVPPTLAALRLAGVSVLVVDDCNDTRDLLNFLLLERGATVRTAASRPEALALLDDFRPEVLISDLRMPERDGYALLDEIRGRGVQVGAILLTGYADAGTRQTALARGFDLHLTKPIDPDELVHAVSTLLNTSRSLKM